jgi:hypothetical protein
MQRQRDTEKERVKDGKTNRHRERESERFKDTEKERVKHARTKREREVER